MRKLVYHISCLLLLLPSIMMRGQALPSLGVADEIKMGTLPNRMDYYLVTNRGERGFADFALVRKDLCEPEDVRDGLGSLPHFGSREPYRFLSENGIGYSEEGYVSYRPDATIFSFKNVPTHDQSVADSTLLMMMDMAAASRRPQAIVISGDIDADKIRERMNLLSMTVSRLVLPAWDCGYAWNPRDSLALRVTFHQSSDVAVINSIFSARRQPAELMNTPQPLVSSAYAHTLAGIVCKRVIRSFRDLGIPLADIRFRYMDSSRSPEDERYSFSLFTSSRYLDQATREFAAILSDIDKNGVDPEEFEDAREKLLSEAKRKEGGRDLSNAEYVSKCISSYLYGSNLASEGAVNTFLAGRRLPVEQELPLFNGFARALLDSASNLTLRYDIPETGMDREVIRNSFNDAWANAAPRTGAYKTDFGDTLSLYEPKSRARLRSETPEPVSGGKLWTFSNGVKVVYKKVSTPGEFRYALMLRGGVSLVPGLHAGEGAFVGDMLGLSDIAGLNGRDFHAMLGANGITMEEEASLSDLRISGIAPKSKFPLLMRALLSVADARKPNKAEFDYYRKGEALRIDMEALSPRDVNSLMDSIMRPEYFYSERKIMENLTDDLPWRAEQYFESVFSKVNDGMLVLVGDLDEERLKKDLSKTVGDFRTQKKYAQRPRVSSRFATGSVTYMEESVPGLVGGGEIGVNVAMSAPISYNMENYMAFKMAVACIRKELVGVLADSGAYVELTERLEVFPAERMSVFVNCRPCRADGLPPGVTPADPLELLDAVRRITSDVSRLDISDKDLNAYKEAMRGVLERRLASPEAIVDDVLVRYGEGKDLVSGSKAAIEAVSAEDVKKILSLLKKGAEVEYVII